MEGNPIVGETFHIPQPQLTLPQEPPRDKSGSHTISCQLRLPETSAQMCRNSSRSSSMLSNTAASTGMLFEGRSSPACQKGAETPQRCRVKPPPSRPREILAYATGLWVRPPPARAGLLATAQGSGSVLPTVPGATLPSYLHLLCLDSLKGRRKSVSFQSPRLRR